MAKALDLSMEEFTGMGVFLTPDELARLRLVMLLPPEKVDPREAPYELVDRWANERKLPRVAGHYGVHLHTGEFLQP